MFGDTVDTYTGTVSFYLYGLVKQPITLEIAYKFVFYLPMIAIAIAGPYPDRSHHPSV